MIRVRDWRWPPESDRTFSDRRFSSPSPRTEIRSRKYSRLRRLSPSLKVFRLPRLAATARFSSMLSSGAVPSIGSWNTRDISFARL